MGIQQFIIDFIGLVNTLFIPFLLGIAFLVVIINVFRFFIVGGANTDSQEKAKSLAIYGTGAFVLIVIFWGVVNMLASSLGLNRDCYDGQVSDYIIEQAALNGSPYTQVDPCAPIQPSPPDPIPEPTPPSPEPTPPTPPIDPPILPTPPTPDPTPPTPPTPPSPDPSPISRLGGEAELTSGDYSDVTLPIDTMIADALPNLTTSLLDNELNLLTDANTPDDTKLQMAFSFAEAGFIGSGEYFVVADAINDVREGAGSNRLSLSEVVSFSDYSTAITSYALSVTETESQLLDNSANAAQATARLNDLYDTGSFNLDSSLAAAQSVYDSFPASEQSAFVDSYVTATNIYLNLNSNGTASQIEASDVTSPGN